MSIIPEIRIHGHSGDLEDFGVDNPVFWHIKPAYGCWSCRTMFLSKDIVMEEDGRCELRRLGSDYLAIRERQSITTDRGRSLLAV